MHEIINYLLNNKEWIFSGLGIFILGAIGTLTKLLYSKNKRKKKFGSMSQINYNTSSSTQIGQQNNYYKETRKHE